MFIDCLQRCIAWDRQEMKRPAFYFDKFIALLSRARTYFLYYLQTSVMVFQIELKNTSLPRELYAALLREKSV